MVISKVEEKKSSQEYKNPYSKMLLESKNIIFRGAPGTGKSYLSKQIAADIISNGFKSCHSDLKSLVNQGFFVFCVWFCVRSRVILSI